ncbi:MAG: Bug family tripartite tricarboxylate transporter substrate binding protein [Burkholderiales bacterium]
MRRQLLAAITLTLFALAQPQAQGQEYPTKPVRLISGFQPGGGSDIVARLVADKLGEAWGRPFVVDNRSGAGGTIALAMTAKAPADGYTLMVISGSQITNAAFVTKVPFDLLKVYAPITQATSGPYLLVVHPSVPVQNVKELIALAKAKPGQLNYASSGTGSFAHLGMELFKSLTATSMVHVPYKGAGPALIELIGGQVQIGVTSATSSMPHVRSGKLRALAVTTLERSPLVPELPSVAESGVPGFSIDSWYGFVAPSGTPAPIIRKLNAEMVKILKTPEVVSYLAKEGAVPKGSTPAELAATMQAELAKWGKVIRSANIKFD